MIISFQNFTKTNLPNRQILSIIKRATHIFVFLLLIIPANEIYADPPPGNTTECNCCGAIIPEEDDYCSDCTLCDNCDGCQNDSEENSCTRERCDCEAPGCDDLCSCGVCRKCDTDTCLNLEFNANPLVILNPNQENIIYEVTATGGEPTYEYAWTEAVKQTTPYKGKFTAPATGSKTISCTVEDRLGGINRISCEATLIVNVCNVESVSPSETTAIMKSDISESITITATLSEILPDDGEIEWQNSTDGGANWSANINGESETQITLYNTEAAGKYKYRARVKGHTGAEDGWEESGDLYIIEFESIDGYIYGESYRKIESMENLTVRANIVASGYIRFEATIAPEDLYFKWSATDGTLTDLSGYSPEGAGNNYKEVKFDAPDGHEQNVTLTFEIKENANGTAFHTETVDLKTIRPYVMRVKFVDNVCGVDEEQHLLENGGENKPEFDAKPPIKNSPICYIIDSFVQVEVDIAGNKTDDRGNHLTKKTEIQVTAKAVYNSGGNEDEFTTITIDDKTEDWQLPDYDVGDQINLHSINRMFDAVTEYEDFKMQWTFEVKDSNGDWVPSYEEETGYSHETIHKSGTYGMYVTFKFNKFGLNLSEDFKILTLDYACKWAKGENLENPILQSILDGFNNEYIYYGNGNCYYLAKDFDHACKALGIYSHLHKWKVSTFLNVDHMYRMYPNEFDPIGEDYNWISFQSHFNIGWTFHEFVEANGYIYDPSAHVKQSGSWLNYETSCFKKYANITNNPPLETKWEWELNQSGISSGCESTAHHIPYDSWPVYREDFTGPPYGF
ncbi:hypothetical protein KAH27_09495 [bacterium]|nr:hypothetical protein [bacterium]